MFGMKRAMSMLLVTSLTLTFVPTLHSQASSSPLARHWTETETETIWTVRYTNCDYGYFVLLGNGVIGHDTLPPAPNHGFLVSLPDVGRKSAAFANEEERYVWVDASYDVLDDQSLSGAVSSNEQVMKNVRGKPGTVKQLRTELAGLSATLSKVEYTTSKGTAAEETIIAVRSGIVYTIGLRTNLKDRSTDEEQFKRIISGFKLLNLPKGECSNG
jgi:hypothetical protein